MDTNQITEIEIFQNHSLLDKGETIHQVPPVPPIAISPKIAVEQPIQSPQSEYKMKIDIENFMNQAQNYLNPNTEVLLESQERSSIVATPMVHKLDDYTLEDGRNTSHSLKPFPKINNWKVQSKKVDVSTLNNSPANFVVKQQDLDQKPNFYFQPNPPVIDKEFVKLLN